MGFSDLLSGVHIEDYFKGLEFPCTKQDLISYAQGRHAPDRVMEMLNKLPDKEYESFTQVLEAGVKAAI